MKKLQLKKDIVANLGTTAMQNLIGGANDQTERCFITSNCPTKDACLDSIVDCIQVTPSVLCVNPPHYPITTSC